MPELRERKPPVLDDIIEPGPIDKARPVLDDSQPLLWDEEELTLGTIDIDDDDMMIAIDDRYDTEEVELLPQVTSLEDEFDLEGSRQGPHLHAASEEEAFGDAGTAETAVVADAPVAEDDGGAVFGSTGGAEAAPETANDQPDFTVALVPEPDGVYANPPETAFDAGLATAESLPYDEARAEPPVEAPFDAAAPAPATPDPAHAANIEALTNRLVRNLMPEFELIMRTRIRQELEKALLRDAD